MTAATAAAGYRASTGHGFTLAGAYDGAYLDVEAADVEGEGVDLMGAAERCALNARLAGWYVVG